MKRPVQRLSQIVTTFGPGAMVDLPTRSVVIGGLERWEMAPGIWRKITEPRLAQRLKQQLVASGRLADDQALELRTPPVEAGRPGQPPRGVQATVFPSWFVCKHIEPPAPGQPANARRRLMTTWTQLDASGGKQKFDHPQTRKKEEVTPLRFVGGCERGHLQDVDWRWVLHGNTPCSKPMWLEERGTTGDPRDTSIVCACGIPPVSLETAFVKGRLGKCRGKRPWLGDEEACSESLRLLTRTATNTYFPQTATVISLPVGEDDLTQILAEFIDNLKVVDTEEKVEFMRQTNSQFKAAVQGYSAKDILARLGPIRAGLNAIAGVPIRLAEFDIFASGEALIGEDKPGSLLHAETLPEAAWRRPTSYDLGGIASVVAVHRLREVTCQYGFTRFEPAPLPADGDIEEIRLAVNSAPLSSGADWLPAIEQFGEGIFLKFDPLAIAQWLARQEVDSRAQSLKDGFQGWAAAKSVPTSQQFAGAPYVMLHSLAHALMAEIALECGYPASAIKERIYALPDPADPAKGRFGLLLYTASAGAQGTLGGLIALAPRIVGIIEQALNRLDICSNDPVCADHEPTETTDERALAGAACHSCLFVAETSCERRNQALDRALLVETIGGQRAAFFTRVPSRLP